MEKTKKILVIDDDDTVRASIKELLESEGYEVYTASDGIEGIDLAKGIVPDLIVCDIMMPKSNGYEVIEKVKKEETLVSVPFIFLTAKSEISDFRNGMGLGADDYLPKPFGASDLLKAIKARLRRFETIQAQEVTLDKEEKKVLTENDRLFIKVNDKPQIIKVGDIVCIKAEGEYSTMFLRTGSKFLVRRLMKRWEEQLPENVFLRIHRSVIVNLNQIEKIEKWYKRSYMVIMKNFDERFFISQRYFTKIKSRFLV